MRVGVCELCNSVKAGLHCFKGRDYCEECLRDMVDYYDEYREHSAFSWEILQVLSESK